MTLLYTGIDEAGYGPMLGPLCVAQASISIEDFSPSLRVPDLWAILSKAVGKTKRDAKSRIPVGDSKALKLSNSSVTQHPLVHLERAVLSFLSARDGRVPTTDIQLFETLGAQLEDRPWYQGDPIELPLANSSDLLAIDSSHLKTTMSKQGVGFVDLRVRVIDVAEFNELYTTHRSKAAATELALRGHLHGVHKRMKNFEHTRIVCDRQSGRTKYHHLLSQVFEDLETREESPRASQYDTGERLGILLTPQADDAYFPVALASMAAKLVRELAMMRFNRYWASRQTELKPTAGYVQDARRWLGDMHSTITNEERTAMVRLA